MAVGSTCLFYLFQLFNMSLILCSVLEVIASSLILNLYSLSLRWDTLCFLVLGGVCLLVSLVGLATRRSDNVLFFYIALLLIAAATQAGFSVASLFLSDYEKHFDGHLANLFRFGMLGMSAVQLFSAVFGWFYRESLCDAIHGEEPEPLVTPSGRPEESKHYQGVRKNYYQ